MSGAMPPNAATTLDGAMPAAAAASRAVGNVRLRHQSVAAATSMRSTVVAATCLEGDGTAVSIGALLG